MSAASQLNSDRSPPGCLDSLLSVRNVRKYFPIREGALQRIVGHVRAVDGVSFDIRRGETVGLVGESGCGKTTLARCVSGLTDITGGGIYFDLPHKQAILLGQLSSPNAEGGPLPGHKQELERIDTAHRIDRLEGEAGRRFRRNCQMVFQDSFASLNPRHLVFDLVSRPLRVYREATGSELTERVVELLEQVGLGRQHLYRYPHQFSGGQRQRISIARALALNPEIIVLDEPTSALDVSVQAQILNLLNELQSQRNLAFLFVTHDLSVIHHMADCVVVMYLGKVSETGDTGELFKAPHHPYTRALMEAKPDLEDESSKYEFKGLEGTVPDPARPPRGCRFHTRCEFATESCGWEIDDIVRCLEYDPAAFETLSGVERRSDFDAVLTFDDAKSANRLAEMLRSGAVPKALQDSLSKLELRDRHVSVAFEEVDEVPLTSRGPGRAAACVLDPSVIASGRNG